MNDCKEKIIQIGEGGFLRGFFDWMIQKMTDEKVFDGKVVVVQPIKEGLCDTLKNQNYKYHHIIRGKEGYEESEINVISRVIKPYDNFSSFLDLAMNESFKIIVSNTTEAGIVFNPCDKPDDAPNISYPAKLTLLLKERFDYSYPGFIILPCELITRNGDKLKEAVISYAKIWNYSDDFISWINNENVFASTLVDRINTGYPKGDEICKKYPDDEMLNTSEYFHLWVIETDYDLEKVLPFSKANLNVIVTKDKYDMYRTRKVRILNGAHTSLVCYALLSGFETVRECIEDENMNKYVRTCIFDEIIPTLDLDKNELIKYANEVLTRFANPYINHMLVSISLNSISKFKVRVLPSILEYKKRFGVYPKNLVFSFAKLIEYYKTKVPNDDPVLIDYIKNGDVHDILSNEKLWDMDLSGDELEKEILKLTSGK